MRHINKRRAKDNRPPIEALYSEEDAVQAAELFTYAEYNETVEITEGVQLTFTDVGHLLGSAAVNLAITENGKTTRITFSGDIGRYRDAILRSPQSFPQADYVIMESTYGDTLHELTMPAANELLKWIEHTCLEKRGNLIIPSFSVGRTQELLYQLNRLELERRLPDLKYFVDSPLSIDATEIIKSHPECYNEQVEKVMRADPDVFKFQGLEYIREAEESKALNELQEPCVIISSSGMAEAGRVKHHIAHNVSAAKNSILLVGYCDPRSLGGLLKAGVDEVRIFGDEYKVNAEVGSISSMSAHGDYDDMIEWLSCQDSAQLKKIFLVHGEHDVQQLFAKRLETRGNADIEIPEQHSAWDI